MSSPQIYVHGTSEADLEETISHVFTQVSGDLEWLAPGELVFLKPALNSPDPYPATTHPLAIKVVADLIKSKGGKVIIGDQSGIEHVVQDKNGVVRGSSQKCYQASGMKEAGDYEFVSLEKEGWQAGFRNFRSAKTKSWPKGFYITNLIDKVDHIVNLPRLSTHGQAGVTLGFKNLVGLLRDDSRMVFHANGPFYSFFKKNIKGSRLSEKSDGRKDFFEKIVEIYDSVADKMRVTLFVGTKAQLTFGPDRYIYRRRNGGGLEAYQYKPKTGLVLASQDPVAAEAFALAAMTVMYREVPLYHRLWQKLLVLLNGQAKELGKQAVADNLFIKYAVARGYGKISTEIKYENILSQFANEISKLLC